MRGEARMTNCGCSTASSSLSFVIVQRVGRSSEFQTRDVLNVRCLPDPKQRDNDRETDGDLGGGNGNNKKDEDLRVIAGQAVRLKVETREGDEREVGGVEHQLERHQ